MVTIFKRKKKWYLNWYENGKRIQRTTRSTKKSIAEELRQEKEKQLLLGHSISQEFPISELLSSYEKTVHAKHKPRTARRYSEMISHFQDYFGDSEKSRVDIINRLDIEGYITWRKEQGRASKTINDELTLLQQIWDFAIDVGAAGQNPVKKTPRLRVSDRKPPRFLRKDEIPIFLSELSKTSPHLCLIAKFILFTGLRRNEVFQLKWEHIDMKKGKIMVWEGKGDKYRDIPLHPSALQAIQDFHSEYGLGKPKEGKVFHTLKGTPLTRGKLYEAFRRAGKRANLEGIIGVHTLRHTFATHLAMAGVPVRTLQEYMGHSDIQTTMIYLHLAESHWESEIQKLDYGI